ncbi:hypothetical protein KR009_001537, partial [Drosophila setifemur]
MDLQREVATDDASTKMETGEPWPEVGPTDSELTLKRSCSQETLTPSRDELAAPSKLSSDAIHLGVLVEKGLIEYDLLDRPSNEDDAGDYPRPVTMFSDSAGIGEIVKEMRDEFMVRLSAKAKSLKGILIKKGMMEEQVVGALTQEPDPEIEVNAEDKAEDKAEEEPKVSKESNDEATAEVEPSVEEATNQEDEIAQVISEITEFTSVIDKDPESVDWSDFRANLLKIHKYYVSSADPECIANDGHNEIHDADNSGSITELSTCARHLRSSIRGLECKMLTLDHSFDVFCDKFGRTVMAKDRVEREMMGLAMMRERISRRLEQMEFEFRSSKEKLFRRG